MKNKRSKDEWLKLLGEQKASGKSAIQFCRDRKIHPNTFYKKRKDFTTGRFVKLPGSCAGNEKIRIKIRDITIEPGKNFSAQELANVIKVILGVVNADLC